MWKGQKVSVIFPAYNEEKNIRTAVNGFFSTKVVDEIVVVDNNSHDNTSREAKKTKARVVVEVNQGYGWALRRGLKDAKGDIIIISKDRKLYKYKVTDKKTVWPNEVNYLLETKKTQLILQTCVPIGTSFQRLLVFAEPI